MRRPGLSKAMAETTPEQAAKNLEQRGLNLKRYQAETRDRARAAGGTFTRAAEPLTLLEMILEIAELSGTCSWQE